MKGRSLLALSVLSLALACEGNQQPTGPTAPADASKFISDGGHGGNRDFFFLPPLVPFPCQTCGFELGKFNSALGGSLQIQICELNPEPSGLPINTTECNPAKRLVGEFGAGTVPLKPIQLVSLPLRQNGWWTLLGLPPDGFYYVLWDPQKSPLPIDPSKYYRIKVLVAGRTAPLGIADLDPMSSLREWRFSKTNDVVQMVNGFLLPIPFRVEQGAFCEGASVCSSVSLTNNSTVDQFVRVPGNNGPIAGVRVPAGEWLPRGGPQDVVFTISRVSTGDNHGNSGVQEKPCHPELTLQQFNACFHFSTIPKLDPISAEYYPLPEGWKPGDQFLKDITTTVCFVLTDQIPLDPREPWVQLWASDVDEAPRPLPSGYADDIMPVHTEQNCGTNSLALNNSSGVTGFASAGWRALKGGLGRLFGVETAYAIDLGLGGITREISNIGPALTAEMKPISTIDLGFQPPGGGVILSARIVGTKVHRGGLPTTGIGSIAPTFGLPMTFTVQGENDGTLAPHLAEPIVATPKLVTEMTNPNQMEVENDATTGWAAVTWWLPSQPGTYQIKAKSIGNARGEVTYTATVAPPLDVLSGLWENDNVLTTRALTRLDIGIDGPVFVHAFASCGDGECDWGTSTATTTAWNSDHQISVVWVDEVATRRVTITYVSASKIHVKLVNDYPDPRVDTTIEEDFHPVN